MIWKKVYIATRGAVLLTTLDLILIVVRRTALVTCPLSSLLLIEINVESEQVDGQLAVLIL